MTTIIKDIKTSTQVENSMSRTTLKENKSKPNKKFIFEKSIDGDVMQGVMGMLG